MKRMACTRGISVLLVLLLLLSVCPVSAMAGDEGGTEPSNPTGDYEIQANGQMGDGSGTGTGDGSGTNTGDGSGTNTGDDSGTNTGDDSGINTGNGSWTDTRNRDGNNNATNTENENGDGTGEDRTEPEEDPTALPSGAMDGGWI